MYPRRDPGGRRARGPRCVPRCSHDDGGSITTAPVPTSWCPRPLGALRRLGRQGRTRRRCLGRPRRAGRSCGSSRPMAVRQPDRRPRCWRPPRPAPSTSPVDRYSGDGWFFTTSSDPAQLADRPRRRRDCARSATGRPRRGSSAGVRVGDVARSETTGGAMARPAAAALGMSTEVLTEVPNSRYLGTRRPGPLTARLAARRPSTDEKGICSGWTRRPGRGPRCPERATPATARPCRAPDELVCAPGTRAAGVASTRYL